jgi:hypothetical protein
MRCWRRLREPGLPSAPRPRTDALRSGRRSGSCVFGPVTLSHGGERTRTARSSAGSRGHSKGGEGLAGRAGLGELHRRIEGSERRPDPALRVGSIAAAGRGPPIRGGIWRHGVPGTPLLSTLAARDLTEDREPGARQQSRRAPTPQRKFSTSMSSARPEGVSAKSSHSSSGEAARNMCSDAPSRRKSSVTSPEEKSKKRRR